MRFLAALGLVALVACGADDRVELRAVAPSTTTTTAAPSPIAEGDRDPLPMHSTTTTTASPPRSVTTHASRGGDRSAPAQPAVIGHGACGGSLPPCSVLRRENRGVDITVWNGGCHYPLGWTGQNRCGSTASGKWQVVRSTWGSKRRADGSCCTPGFGGYMNAADAPESVQDDHARLLWDHGRGCAHWRWCG